MKLFHLFQEIYKYYQVLEDIDTNFVFEKNTKIINIMSETHITKDNYNIKMFGHYYVNLINKLENILGKSESSVIENLFFISQNFLAHSLPQNVGYLKIDCISTNDYLAPFIDVSNRLIYFLVDSIELKNIIDNFDLIDISKNFYDNLPPCKKFFITQNTDFVNSINHPIGGISLIVDNIDESVDLILKLATKFDFQCDIVVIGVNEKIHKWQENLLKKGVVFVNWQKIIIPKISTDLASYNTLANGIIKFS